MNVRALMPVLILMCFSSACAPASTPTPVRLPTLTPAPLPTAVPTPPAASLAALGVGSGNAPADVPTCQGAKSLDEPVKFSWAGIDDVVRDTPKSNWTYYRCGESQVALSVFYRLWMPKPPYNWLEAYWEQRREAIMGVYFYNSGSQTVPNRWLYLWFLRGNSDGQNSYLVAAWWDIPRSC